MGCFNVSCLISKLTIQIGDSCYLLPLIRNPINRRGRTIGVDSPCSMYLYPTDIYTPLCFPIKGTYDDYGSIENIEKNKNTEALEKYFGIPIETIVEVLTDNRGREPLDIYDSFSSYCKLFFEYPEVLKEYGISNKDFLLKLGFEEISGEFRHPNYDYKIILDEKLNEGHIISNEKQVKFFTHNFSANFFEAHYKMTDKLFGLKNGELFNKIKDVSATFILAEVYENLLFYKNDWDYELNSHFLLNHGFSLNSDGSFIRDGYTINLVQGEISSDKESGIDFNPRMDGDEFKKFWKKLTNKRLKGKNSIEVEYQNYIYQCMLYKNDKDDIYNILYAYTFKEQMAFSKFIPNFLTIYEDSLFDLESEWKLMYKFRDSIYTMNILLTPTFQGTQCGDIESELYLAKLTYEIAKRRQEGEF